MTKEHRAPPSDTRRMLGWAAGVLLATIVIVVLSGVARNNLDPGVALGVLGPTVGGVFAGIVFNADRRSKGEGDDDDS